MHISDACEKLPAMMNIRLGQVELDLAVLMERCKGVGHAGRRVKLDSQTLHHAVTANRALVPSTSSDEVPISLQDGLHASAFVTQRRQHHWAHATSREVCSARIAVELTGAIWMLYHDFELTAVDLSSLLTTEHELPLSFIHALARAVRQGAPKLAEIKLRSFVIPIHRLRYERKYNRFPSIIAPRRLVAAFMIKDSHCFLRIGALVPSTQGRLSQMTVQARLLNFDLRYMKCR